jgi:hypothetical protein
LIELRAVSFAIAAKKTPLRSIFCRIKIEKNPLSIGVNVKREEHSEYQI